MIYIYIYIYIYIQISLYIIDISCLHIILLILSYCHIDFIDSAGIGWYILHDCVFPKNFLPDFWPSSGEDVLQKWCNFCMNITTL